MSNYHFGDDYDLDYYPPEASDGMGGVDWDKVERVEIECDVYVKERTCRMEWDEDGEGDELYPVGHVTCSACGAWLYAVNTMRFCPNCGARITEEE